MWDGSAWSALDTGTDGPVKAIATDGYNVYVGGNFSAAGGVAAHNIAKWDSYASVWSSLGTGGGGTNGTVDSIAVGFGGVVYAGGTFSMAGGIPVSNIARWDGSAWFDMNNGTNGTVNALAINGSGDGVYVGGAFSTAGGIGAHNIAMWSDSGWD